MIDTGAFSLKHGRKTCWFDCHRRFLPSDHLFRSNKTDWYKGRNARNQGPPRVYSGIEILHGLDSIGMKKITEIGAEVANKAAGKNSGWKKRNIFWDLPYWGDLLNRHNLDVMHIEKNVFDNVFNTVLNVPNQTKDNLKARYYIKEICRLPELEPDEDGHYAKAKYMLSTEEKKLLFEWMRSIKFPDGYVSNLSRCIDVQSHTVFGMKSHDCHVFMQRLMPVAFRPFLEQKH